jgi:hypothetical protein
MARTKMEEKEIEVPEVELDDMPLREVPKTPLKEQQSSYKAVNNEYNDEEELVNCLRNERVIVRYVPKANGIWGNNPKHLLAGGMAENAIKTFVVPTLTSGLYVDVLTKSEKKFLENIMGLEANALSIYKKVNNYWDDTNETGVGRVRLTKQDNILDLSIPEDYIKYKILLANTNFIAPSLQVLQDKPKATYQFVLIAEGEEVKQAKSGMSATMQCYKEYGKIEEDINTLRTIIEIVDGRPTAPTAKLDFLQTKANELIQANPKMFLKVITDPLIPTKVLIKRSIEAGLISKRGNYLYLRSDNTPLCENGEEPTFTSAAKYLNAPKHQELKFTLEAKLKE